MSKRNTTLPYPFPSFFFLCLLTQCALFYVLFFQLLLVSTPLYCLLPSKLNTLSQRSRSNTSEICTKDCLTFVRHTKLTLIVVRRSIVTPSCFTIDVLQCLLVGCISNFIPSLRDVSAIYLSCYFSFKSRTFCFCSNFLDQSAKAVRNYVFNICIALRQVNTSLIVRRFLLFCCTTDEFQNKWARSVLSPFRAASLFCMKLFLLPCENTFKLSQWLPADLKFLNIWSGGECIAGVETYLVHCMCYGRTHSWSQRDDDPQVCA